MSVNVLRGIIVVMVIAIGLGLFVVISSLNNEPDPTIDDHRQAQEEWRSLDPIAQNIICNMWLDAKNDAMKIDELFEAEVDPAYKKARIDLMERECDDV